MINYSDKYSTKKLHMFNTDNISSSARQRITSNVLRARKTACPMYHFNGVALQMESALYKTEHKGVEIYKGLTTKLGYFIVYGDEFTEVIIDNQVIGIVPQAYIQDFVSVNLFVLTDEELDANSPFLMHRPPEQEIVYSRTLINRLILDPVEPEIVEQVLDKVMAFTPDTIAVVTGTELKDHIKSGQRVYQLLITVILLMTTGFEAYYDKIKLIAQYAYILKKRRILTLARLHMLFRHKHITILGVYTIIPKRCKAMTLALLYYIKFKNRERKDDIFSCICSYNSG